MELCKNKHYQKSTIIRKAATNFHCGIRLQLEGAIYRPVSFPLMLRYCANLKAIRYESTSLNRIVDDKSHRRSFSQI